MMNIIKIRGDKAEGGKVGEDTYYLYWRWLRDLSIRASLTLLLFSLTSSPALSASGNVKDEGSSHIWSGLKGQKITLFYPGVASWEFVTSDDHRLGSKKINKGKRNCRHCHLTDDGELDLKAREIASGEAKMKRSRRVFEPTPIPGKKGLLEAELKASFDEKYLYINLSWPSAGAGWSQPKGEVLPDRVSLQLNKTNDPFARYGCFITCHNDVESMPLSPSEKAVREHPYYKRINRDDVHLYAYYTRAGSWSEMAGDDLLASLSKDDGILDLWSVTLSDKAAAPLDGWVFEDRRWEDESDVAGTGTHNGGRYTVTFKRALRTDDPFDIQLEGGDTFSLGVAIHDNDVDKRYHYVSYPYKISLGDPGSSKANSKTNGKVDLRAEKR